MLKVMICGMGIFSWTLVLSKVISPFFEDIYTGYMMGASCGLLLGSTLTLIFIYTTEKLNIGPTLLTNKYHSPSSS